MSYELTINGQRIDILDKVQPAHKCVVPFIGYSQYMAGEPATVMCSCGWSEAVVGSENVAWGAVRDHHADEYAKIEEAEKVAAAPAVRKGEESNGGVYLHEGVRAYVFTFVGRDGRKAQVIFDRFGMQSDQFHKYGRAQLTSNALGSIMQTFGTDWLDTFTVAVDELR